MAWLRLIWRTLRLALHVGLGITVTFLFCRRNRETGEYSHNHKFISWWHARLLRILGVELEVIGHRPQAPALLVANHVSWLDVPVIGALAPTSFLSKHEVRSWPVIGWLAAATGTLFIQRGSGQTGVITEAIADRLEAEGLLTLFPEGTTTDGSDVRPFFSRLFAAALDTGNKVVPVGLRYHIDGALDPLAPFVDNQPLAENLREILKRSCTHVRVEFRDALNVSGLDRRSAAELARRAIRDAIIPGPYGEDADSNAAADNVSGR